LTVLAEVPDDAVAMRDEPFGPLALIIPVRTLDAAIQTANRLPFGLAAYAFTDRASSIAQLSDELECGNLAINHVTASYADTPFGGVKDSGYGREGGMEGLQAYTTAKLVSYRRP
jgi:succinate-semialdehyde dehydrogenase/glutarate-semialdehyde dehydrogenase